MTDFKDFDRGLSDLRDAFAQAHLDRQAGVKRYVAMMDALAAAFTLYYEDLPLEERKEMLKAFGKLYEAAASCIEEEEPQTNVTPLRPK